MRYEVYSYRWLLSFLSKTQKLLAVLILFLMAGMILHAQIESSSASSVRIVDYLNHPERSDQLFIYCVSNTSGDIKGSLTASHPDDAVSDYDFEWRKYNPALPGFDPVFSQNLQVKTSTVNDLESGGYQVEITNGGSNDTLLVAWVFINKPKVSVKIQNFTCDYLALKADTMLPQIFTYYDPVDHSQYSEPNDLSFIWSAIPDIWIPNASIYPDPYLNSPPFVDTDFYLEVTDSFGCQNEDSLFYHSIHVKPDFTVEPTQGEAPLDVSFTNTSVNAVRYEWHFGDDSASILENPEPHTYYIPKPIPPEVNGYEVKLIAWSQEGCKDSSEAQYVIVDPSYLDVPNVFTPNDDTWNDRFVVSSQSLRSIHVQVFSRIGKKVYEFSGQGTKLQEWKGWNGKINGGNDASPGVYYYIIRAVGWDDEEYKGKVYRGTVYLIREK